MSLKAGDVPFWYKGVRFRVGFLEVCDVILEEADVASALHEAIGIDDVLPVVFEFTDEITACRLNVMYRGGHQFVYHTVNFYRSEASRQEGGNALLGECPLVIGGELAAKAYRKGKAAVVVLDVVEEVLPVSAYVHALRLPALDERVHHFIEGCPLVRRFTVEGDAVDAVYQLLPLLGLPLFRRIFRRVAPSIILVIRYVALLVR